MNDLLAPAFAKHASIGIYWQLMNWQLMSKDEKPLIWQKSTKGVETPRPDRELILKRLDDARRLAEGD